MDWGVALNAHADIGGRQRPLARLRLLTIDIAMVVTPFGPTL